MLRSLILLAQLFAGIDMEEGARNDFLQEVSNPAETIKVFVEMVQASPAPINHQDSRHGRGLDSTVSVETDTAAIGWMATTEAVTAMQRGVVATAAIAARVHDSKPPPFDI